MGYAGILTSEMFGLRGIFDASTKELLRDRRTLIEIEIRSFTDKRKLAELDPKIENLGFSTNHWDADYQEF